MKNGKQGRAIPALLLLLAAVLAVLAFLAMGRREDEPVAQGNLLTNGDFSAVTGEMPDGWEKGMWVTSAGASYLEAVTLEDGTRAVLIENAAANDARFEQTVAVRPNATYRLTARVRAEGIDTAKTGANVSFLGIYGTSESVYDTDGAWTTVTLYAQTGKEQREATVCLRLGGYGAENTGRAWFADACLEQVETVPVGTSVLDIATPAPQKEQKAESGSASPIPAQAGIAALYLLAALLIARCMLAGGHKIPRVYPALAALLAVAAVLRLVLAAVVPGYDVDMGCYGAWAGKMAASGPASFYEEGYFCDYPPAYLLVLGAQGLLARVLGISLGSMEGQFLLKTAPIACDIALAFLMFAVSKRRLGGCAALGVAALMALNPAYVLTGACWGQIDAVLALLLVLMLLAAREGRWTAAIALFALAVLTKPQAGLLVPLGIAALARDVIGRGMEAQEKSRTRRSALLGLLAGAGVTLAIVLPFSVNQASPLWLVDKYVETLSSYDYATLSTGNLMYLLGGN